MKCPHPLGPANCPIAGATCTPGGKTGHLLHFYLHINSCLWTTRSLNELLNDFYCVWGVTSLRMLYLSFLPGV